MSFTMEDFNRQYFKEHFARLTSDERREILQAMSPEERLADLTIEEIQQYLAQRSAPESGGSPKKRRKR